MMGVLFFSLSLLPYLSLSFLRTMGVLIFFLIFSVLAQPCHGFPEQIDIPAALACFRVPDMEMDDGSAGLRRLNG